MSKQKSITIVTGFYFPEDTAIGLYTTQFSKFLVKQGYEVKVITGFPNYPQWKIHDQYKNLHYFYTENHEYIEIIRYKQYVPSKVTFKGRVLMMLSLFYGTFRNLSKIKKSDVIICIVPFTISILPSVLLSRRTKSKLWVHIQDFEFDLALDSGIIKKESVFFNLFKRIVFGFERKMLNSADVISSISYSMQDKILQKSNQTDPYYFPNWVSSEKINPTTSSQHRFINPKVFTLLYSGNIGDKQDWGFLEKLCAFIHPDDHIEIVIVGDGGFKNNLTEMLQTFSFVKFFDPIPYDQLNDLLCSADVHFLFQKPEVVDTIMPSKILGMMASSKPSIVSGNKNSEVATIMSQSEGGFYFSQNDSVSSIYTTILELKNNAALGEQMGAKARNYILEKFSEEKILANFEERLKHLVALKKEV